MNPNIKMLNRRVKGIIIPLHEDAVGYEFSYYTAQLVLLLEQCLIYDVDKNFYSGYSSSYYVHILIQGNGYILEIGDIKYDEFIIKFYIKNTEEGFKAYIQFSKWFESSNIPRLLEKFGSISNILSISDSSLNIMETIAMFKLIRKISKIIPEVIEIKFKNKSKSNKPYKTFPRPKQEDKRYYITPKNIPYKQDIKIKESKYNISITIPEFYFDSENVKLYIKKNVNGVDEYTEILKSSDIKNMPFDKNIKSQLQFGDIFSDSDICIRDMNGNETVIISSNDLITTLFE